MRTFTLRFLCLLGIIFFSTQAFSQTYGYGIYADSSDFNTSGTFLTDPDVLEPEITHSSTGVILDTITSGNPDSVYFGNNALWVRFAGGSSNKIRWEVTSDSIPTAFFPEWNYQATLTFWIKLLEPIGFSYEVEAGRNGGDPNNSDEDMATFHGLDTSITDWQEITIDLSERVEGNTFDYSTFVYFAFRSRDNASNFLVDEMHVEYTPIPYGIYAEKPNFNLGGNFLTDRRMGDPEITHSSTGVILNTVTSGNPDSVYFGHNALHVQFAGGSSNKIRWEITSDITPTAFFPEWNTGTLVFWIKLLEPIGFSYEVEAGRNGGDPNNSDEDMATFHGLDTNSTDWQEIRIALSDSVEGNVFDFSTFVYFAFRSRDNASNFLVDEMYVTWDVIGSVTTLEIPIVHDNDDAEEVKTAIAGEGTVLGEMDLGSSDLEIIFDHEPQYVGMIFRDVQIPKGQIIDSAYVQFTVDATNPGVTDVDLPGIYIYGAKEATVDSIYDELFSISSHPATTAQVDWSPAPSVNVGDRTEAERTADISAIIEEIVAQDGWVPGNNIMIVISGPAEQTEDINREFEANASVDDTKLHVMFEQGVTAVENLNLQIPSGYTLSQNYPNPFNPTTSIVYQLAKNGDVQLSIFNMLGQRIRTMVNGAQNAGTHTVVWDGKNDFGKNVSTGIYLYQLRTSDFVKTKKMVLVR